MNLTDLVLQNRPALDRIADANGLTPGQMDEAVAALMPAFSAGLTRNTREPDGAASLLRALGSGRHATYADDPARLSDAGARSEGNAILSHLFGRKKVSRQVAAQAASRTGLSQGILQKLLPMLAPIVLDALVKGLTGGAKRGSGGLGDALGQAAGGGLLGTLVESLADGFLGGARSGMPRRRRAPTQRRRETDSGLGLEDLLGGMLGGGSARSRVAPQRQTPRRAPRPAQRRAPSRPARRGSGDAIVDELLGNAPSRRGPNPFDRVLDPGPATEPAYREGMGGILESILGR